MTPIGLVGVAGAVVAVAALVWLARCRHDTQVLEHRDDGWYVVCGQCRRAVLLNPRERSAPLATGEYDEHKALEGRQRAEQYADARFRQEASRSRPMNGRPATAPAPNVRPFADGKKAAR